MAMKFDHAMVAQTIAGLRALPQRGRYRCIAADFPWWWSGGRKGRPQHYPRMRDQEIYALGEAIRELADPEGCWFFDWGLRTKPHAALEAMRRCGFRFSSSAFVLIKLHKRYFENGEPLLIPLSAVFKGQGFTTRKNAEDCWLGRIGRPTRLNKTIDEVLFAPREEHSRKPLKFYRLVEKFCDGPRVELFARQRRDGWDAFGNQVDLFPPQKPLAIRRRRERSPLPPEPGHDDMLEATP